MAQPASHEETRTLWLFLLGLQLLALIFGIVVAITARSTPSVEATLTDQDSCVAEAQKAEALGIKVPGELLARCQFLERRASTLQLIKDKLSNIESTQGQV